MRPLHPLCLFLIHWSTTYASFLSDTLVRKDQLQHVLEHEPAQRASCQEAVRLSLLSVATTVLSTFRSTPVP